MSQVTEPEKVQKDGLMVRDAKAGDFLVKVKAMAISDLQNNAEPFDYCIIAVKSYDTEWSAKMMDRHGMLRPFPQLVGRRVHVSDR